MLTLAQQFHTGFVVDDLEDALECFGTAFAGSWTPIELVALKLTGPVGRIEIDLRLAFSRQGPQRFELIEAVEGTIWEVPRSPLGHASPPHHVGFFVEDVVAESERLESVGAPLLHTIDDGSGAVRFFAYHRLPSGLLVELVDGRSRAAFERWFAGGTFPGGGAA